MVTDIDELQQRLEDPEANFTSEEVTTLIDWRIRQELSNDYQTQRVASALQQSVISTETVNAAMQQIQALWDNSPMVPTLQVVTYEQE